MLNQHTLPAAFASGHYYGRGRVTSPAHWIVRYLTVYNANGVAAKSEDVANKAMVGSRLETEVPGAWEGPQKHAGQCYKFLSGNTIVFPYRSELRDGQDQSIAACIMLCKLIAFPAEFSVTYTPLDMGNTVVITCPESFIKECEKFRKASYTRSKTMKRPGIASYYNTMGNRSETLGFLCDYLNLGKCPSVHSPIANYGYQLDVTEDGAEKDVQAINRVWEGLKEFLDKVRSLPGLKETDRVMLSDPAVTIDKKLVTGLFIDAEISPIECMLGLQECEKANRKYDATYKKLLDTLSKYLGFTTLGE